MSARGLLVALVLCGVLAGLVYWSDKTKKEEEAKGGADAANNIIKNVKDEDVRKIEIVRKDVPPTVLERGANNDWQMKAPATLRVDQTEANSLVSAYTGLSQDRVVEEKPAGLSAYGLNAPSVEVRVSTKDNKVQKVLIGDETPTGGSFFAKVDTDPKVFTVYSGTKTSFDKVVAESTKIWEISVKVAVTANAFSSSAKEKIEAAGGTATVV